MSVPGLDAKHTWNGGLVLNDDLLTPYHYALSEIGNWRSLPDTELAADPAISRHGEIARSSKRRGKTIAYTGAVVARTGPDMHEGADKLLAEFFDTEVGEMLVTPFAGVGGPSYFYLARPLSIVSDDKWVVGPHASRSGGWERAFVLSMRMDDARFYATAEVEVQSGGTLTNVPAGQPWSWTTNTSGWPAQPNSVGISVTNAGKADADPVLELGGRNSGSVVAPRVANWVTKTGLRFSEGLVLAAGDSIVVDFANRTCIRSSNGEDVDPYRIADYSDWWDDGVPGLLRGATQEIRYGAKAVGAGMRVTVRFNPPRY